MHPRWMMQEGGSTVRPWLGLGRTESNVRCKSRVEARLELRHDQNGDGWYVELSLAVQPAKNVWETDSHCTDARVVKVASLSFGLGTA